MNRPDFDEFAALWQGHPDPAEQARMERMARRARRKGRLLAYSDIACVVLFVVGCVLAAFLSHNRVTTATGVVILIVTIWLTWRRRGYRQMVRTVDTSDRRSFFESSLNNARANLRRVTLSVALIPLLVPASLIFKVTWRTGAATWEEILQAFVLWAHSIRAPILCFFLVIIVALSMRSRRKLKAEIRQLEQIRGAYQEHSHEEESRGQPR